MIRVENIDVWGFKHAIRGMRNPLESWEDSDSAFLDYDGNYYSIFESEVDPTSFPKYVDDQYIVGPKDLDLMKRLYKGGPDHAKYLRQIYVSLDIIAPLYWWKEFDTYKIGTTSNSCSTMHKIAAKEFVVDDFSHEWLFADDYEQYDEGENECFVESGDLDYALYDGEGESAKIYPMEVLEITIQALNKCREEYLKTKNKDVWWQMIQLLPSTYEQRRTITMSYANVMNMIDQRSNHKLNEWRAFTRMLKDDLPYVKEIRGEA